MRRVLIIRQREEALPLSNLLKQKGIASYTFPLFRPRFFTVPLLDAPQGLIITSKNALRSLENREELKSLTLYAVGDKTAEFAKNKGFVNVYSASGNNQNLCNLILKKASPSSGTLYYLSGTITREDFITTLAKEGFCVKQHIVYELKAKKTFPSALIKALTHHEISHVLFFSPHTTAHFIDLLKKESLVSLASQITSLCLSRDVLKVALSIHWKEAWVSSHPTLNSIMDYFDAEK